MRRPLSASSTLALLLVTAVACADGTGPDSDLLVVRRIDSGIRLENRTSEPRYHLAMDGDFMARANYVICGDPEQCASVAPRSAVTIPLAEVAGYVRGESELVVVLHWRLVPDPGGGWSPDSVRATRVRVR